MSLVSLEADGKRRRHPALRHLDVEVRDKVVSG